MWGTRVRPLCSFVRARAAAERDAREQLAGERGRPLVQDEPEGEGYRQMHPGVLPERL